MSGCSYGLFFEQVLLGVDLSSSETQTKLSFAASGTRSEAWTVPIMGRDLRISGEAGTESQGGGTPG